jgi:hypothetical protein
MFHLRPLVLTFALLLGAGALSVPARAQEEEGHMHGPDGRHIAVAGTSGGGSASILSHHDLKITDTRQPGTDGNGVVVTGCEVHSVVYRKDDRQNAVHKEHNAFEPENGVYGSHMMYKEPGEYVIVEKITMPDKKEVTLEFPIWVPSPSGSVQEKHGISQTWYVLGALGALLLVVGAYVLGRRSGRQVAATLLVLGLLLGFPPNHIALAEEEEGHMHGPDGRHIAVAGKFGDVSVPLKAYPTADRGESAVQTRDPYRFELSIENEEL